MEQWHVVVLLMGGIGLLLLSVIARAKYKEQYELKSIDLALVIMPLLFVLLISGKMKMFDLFGVKADFSDMFSDAAEANINRQVSGASSPSVNEVVNMLRADTKAGIRKIPKLVKNKTQALTFQLGHGGYYGPAIQKYFDALYASSYLQYLVVFDEQGKLFGLYDVLDLAVYFRANDQAAYRNFAKWLNRPNAVFQSKLIRLPGFISADKAVSREQSKRIVLKKMDELRLNSLPVVDNDGVFVGTIERAELTASLILDVVDRLEGDDSKSLSK